jgi:hypothetical protein
VYFGVLASKDSRFRGIDNGVDDMDSAPSRRMTEFCV